MPPMKTILALALPLIATIAAADSILVERIDVNAAKRISPAIILAETRLVAGKTYTQDEIDQAINRVRRLPFVLAVDADYKPGSTAGARVLRINVEEMANFNWSLDTSAVAHGSRGGSGSGATAAGSIGYRFFPGRNGTLDVSLGDTNMSLIGNTQREATLSYNAYGLLGTSAYASVGVGTIFRTNGQYDINPAALLGVPLTRTQTIEAAFSRTTSRLERSVDGIADPIRSSVRVTETGLTWLLQTADDPYFARHGFDAAAGPSWTRNEIDLPFVLTFPKPAHVVPGQQSQREFSLNASAAKFWPLRESSAAWARFVGSSTRITGTANGNPFPAQRWNVGDALVGVAHDFNREMGESTQSRTRLELGLGYHVDRLSGSGLLNRSGAEAEIGVAYRNRFGILHVTASYISR